MNVELRLSDLVNACSAIRVYASRLSDYGSEAEAQRFRGIADRIVNQVSLVLGEPVDVPELPTPGA